MESRGGGDWTSGVALCSGDVGSLELGPKALEHVALLRALTGTLHDDLLVRHTAQPSRKTTQIINNDYILPKVGNRTGRAGGGARKKFIFSLSCNPHTYSVLMYPASHVE